MRKSQQLPHEMLLGEAMLVYEFENMDSFGVPGDKLKGGRFQNWSLREKVDN